MASLTSPALLLPFTSTTHQLSSSPSAHNSHPFVAALQLSLLPSSLRIRCRRFSAFPLEMSAAESSPPPPPASQPSAPARQVHTTATRTIRLQQLPPKVWPSLKSLILTRRQLLLAVLVPLVLALLAHSLLSRSSSPSSPSLLSSLLHRLAPSRFRRSPAVNSTSPLHPTWRLVNNTAEGVALFRYLASLDPSSPIAPSEKAALELLLPPHLVSLASHPTTRRVLRRGALPGVYEAVEARTRRIDDSLDQLLQPRQGQGQDQAKAAIEQLVVLGAGSDTRGLRYHPQLSREGVAVFEVDLPGTQARKRERLHEGLQKGQHLRTEGDLQAAVSNIRYVPLNLTEAARRPPPAKGEAQSAPSAMKPLWEGLKGAGYSEEKPTLFILEGSLRTCRLRW